MVIDPTAGPSNDPACGGALCGLRKITFTTGAEIVVTYFNVASASLVNISPWHAPQGATLDVEITGANTHFTPGTTQVNFDPFITVNSVTVNSLTDVVANITVHDDTVANGAAWPGGHIAYVNTGSEQLIIGFAVDPPASAVLLSVDPPSGAQGETKDVTITGQLTHFEAGVTETILGAGVKVSNLVVTSPTTATATIAVSPTAPVGGNSVIMLTGTEIVSGTGFSVTPGASEIIAITTIADIGCGETCVNSPPSKGPSRVPQVTQLQTVQLSIIGQGTHWLNGETTASFGPGVNIDQLRVTDATHATVQITVLSSAPVGFAPLIMNTDGEVTALQQALDIEQGFPTLLSITPGGAQHGATLNLQVLGRFTHWTNATTATFNDRITVNSFQPIDNVSGIFNITVNPTAYVDTPGACHGITITTGTEQVSLGDAFCVQTGAEQINSIDPGLGLQGQTAKVTITGSATHFTAGVTSANFGPGINVGNVSVTSPTIAVVDLAITTSAPTGFHDVTVYTLGEVATKQFAFQVRPGWGTLNEVAPYQGEQAQTLNVHLIGQYTNFINGVTTVTFGPGITVNSLTVGATDSAWANITIDPLAYTGSRTVTMTTPGVPCAALAANVCAAGETTGSEIVTTTKFTVIPGPAIISQVTPPGGNQGQEVVFQITGENTHWAQNLTQFWIAGGGGPGSELVINSVVINSPTSATVDLTISPAINPGPRSIYMVTAGEVLVDSGAFILTGGIPAITYISPNNAAPGTTNLPVTIHGIYTQWDATTTTVDFGPGVTVQTFQVDNSTTINAVVSVESKAKDGWRTVFVRTGNQGLTGNFQVYTPPPPVPYISYYWPSQGMPGHTFTISFAGVNTHWDPNPVTGTQATFGDGITANTFEITSPTTARANITIDSKTYEGSRQFTFTTNSESVATYFNVVISHPTLSIVDPSQAMQGATLDVNIMGQYTSFVTGLTTFDFGPGITVNGPPLVHGATIATVNISIDQLAQLGGRSVVATTLDQVVSGAGFYVTPSAAVITSATPNTALQGNTITIEVTGKNTHWDNSTRFYFGAGIVVATTTVNGPTNATLVLSLPSLAPLGPTSFEAHTKGEVASITNGFVVQPGTPLILSSGPASAPQQGNVTFTILGQVTKWAQTIPQVDFGPGVVITSVVPTNDTSMTVKGFVQATTSTGPRYLTISTDTQVLNLPYPVFYVTQGPAVVSKVSPSAANQGDTLDVTITGTNTNWVQGITQLTLPIGIFNSFSVLSPTSATVNITVSKTAPVGLATVTMTTLGEVATEANAFQVIQTQPQMLFINPASAAQGDTKTVTITSLYTHFDSTTTANFGPGVTVNSVTPLTSTSLQANITVEPTTPLGYRNVSVTTGTEIIGSTSLFHVTTGPAAILSLSPATGGQGRSVTVHVTGSQTNFSPGVTTASFGGNISVTGLTVIDATHADVTVSIPNSTSVGPTYDVTLTTGGQVATISGGFSVTLGNARIGSVSPPTGHQGDVIDVTLTGLLTNFVNGTSTAGFGSGITVNSLTVSDQYTAIARITLDPAATPGSRTVTVTTTGEVASITGGFTVLAGQPHLVSASPGSAKAGDTVNVIVNSAFTNFAQGVSTVDFGGGVTTNSVTVNGPGQLTANISISATTTVGARNVTVTTNGEVVTLNNGFNVLAGVPVITQINPNIGVPGSTVPVTIYGRFTGWGPDTNVSFGPGISVSGSAYGSAGSVGFNNSGNISATINIDAGASLGPRDVIVTTGTEVETVPGGFTVQPTTVTPPSVILLSPVANSSGIPINSNVIVVFSQPMDRTTMDSSTIYLSLNNSAPVPINLSLDASGRVLTITPNSLLAVASQYYVRLSSGIKDASGNALNAYGTWLYTTFDVHNTAPKVTAVNPPVGISGVGTNVVIQIQFDTQMDESIQAGLTVNDGSSNIAGALSWNNDANCCGNHLYFTPAAPLLPNHAYTVNYGAPLADTAGNALQAGSFSFTTGSGPDTAQSYANFDFQQWQENVGTNFSPRVTFTKPVNPIAVNTSTLVLYNYDTGKYLRGTVTVAADAMSAVFTPSLPLLPSTSYTFHMGAGYFDMDGNYLNGNSGYFTTAATADATPPTVSSIFPADGSTSVPLNARVTVSINEPIDPASWSQNSIRPLDGANSPVAGTVSTLDNQTLTFTPAVLSPGVTYTVNASGFTDAVGNAVTPFTSSFTTGSSSSSGGLSLVSVSPAMGSTDVSNNTPIVLIFNNAINPASVGSSTLLVMNGWNSNYGLSGNYQVSGNQVTFTPSSPFPLGAHIYLGSCNGPTDVVGNNIPGCYAQLASFTVSSSATPDTSAFQVVAFSPANGAANVGLRAPVVATFNKSFNPNTLDGGDNSGDFALFAGDAVWCRSYTKSQDNMTLRFNCSAMPSSTAMTAFLTSGIQDISGNPLANFRSQFATAAYDWSGHGTVISTRPGNASGGIGSNSPIVLFTNLPVTPGSAASGVKVAQNYAVITGAVQVLDNGYTVQFTPDSPLLPGALVQWWVTGDLVDATYGSSFTTAYGYFSVASDTSAAAPTVQVLSPPHGSYGAPNAVVDVQFNTPLDPATVTSDNIYLTDQNTGLHVAATYSMPAPNVVHLVPLANFGSNTYIHLYVTSELHSSTSVPASPNNWYFMTAGLSVDNTVPSIVSAVPYDGAGNVGINVSPGVVFSKAIDPVSVNGSTFQVLNGAAPLVGSYWVSSDNTRVGFTPNAPLPPNATLTMSINGITDQIGHPVTFTSHFLTANGPDFTAPTIVTTNLSPDTTVTRNIVPTFQFSESMDVTTFGSNNFFIRDVLLGWQKIPTTLSWSADQSVAYLTPATPFAAGRQYYLNVGGGTDLAGNQMSGIGSYFYADFASSYIAPTVANLNPQDGATGVGVNAVIQAQFTAPIDPNTVAGVALSAGGVQFPTTPVLSSGNTVLQLVPSTPLAGNTTYTLTVAGVKDSAGNTVSTVTGSFTTRPTYDFSHPRVVNYDPPNYGTVGTNVVPKLVFNKPLNPITVSNSTFRMFLSVTGQSIPLTVTLAPDRLSLTMAPQIALLPNTQYHYQACCGYQDANGNNGDQIDLYFYTGSGSDTVGPAVSISPLPNAIGIPLNARVAATLNEAIDATSWSQSSIQLLDGANNPVAGTIAQNDNQTLTFTPAASLSAGVTYSVNVAGFKDTVGNAVVPFTSQFTTGSVTASGGLYITSRDPVWGATEVSSTQPIVLTFSQILDPQTVNASSLRVMKGWDSNRGLAGTYLVEGNKVTFTPIAPYPAGALIYVGNCNGPYDVLGETIPGCFPQYLAQFTVSSGGADTAPLQVLSVNPPDGTTNVRRNMPVAVTFNKSINPSSAQSGNNALLFSGEAVQSSGGVSMSVDNRTMYFSVGLYSGTNYTIALTAGGITDMSGNPLSSTFTSRFTTAPDPGTSGGSVSGVSPTWNATGVPTDSLLTLYPDHVVDPSTLAGNLRVTVNGENYPGTVQRVGNGHEVQYTPSTPFPYGAVVQWFFSGARDVDGNSINGTSGVFYIQGQANPATTTPQVVAVSPGGWAGSPPTNAEIDIQYNVPIDATTVNGSGWFNDGTSVTATLLAPNIIRLVPNSPLSPSTTYYLCSSAVTGTNGLASSRSCWLTYFTTGAGPDYTSGTITLGPPNGSVNVGTNAYIRIGFSKPVDRITVNEGTLTVTSNGQPVEGTLSFGSDATSANFYPVNPLPPSSNISISVNGVLDYAGNVFVGASSQFTTADGPDFSSASVAFDFPHWTTVAPNSTFSCRYSKPMDPLTINSSGTYIWSDGMNARVPVTYTFSADLMSVTMTPLAPLAPTPPEYHYVCQNAIDLTGNVQSNDSRYFHVGTSDDAVAPTLLYANPPNGATGVALNTNNGPWCGTSLGLLFSKPVSGSSFGKITLTPAGGSPMAIGFCQGNGDAAVMVALPYTLQSNTTYTFNVAGVRDYAGNAMAPVSSSFTTGSSFDWSPPSVTAFFPVDGSTDVDIHTVPSITFSEAMNPVIMSSGQVYLLDQNRDVKIPTTISFSADYRTVYLTPAAPLEPATIYRLYMWIHDWWITDIAGNNVNTGQVWSTFTTGTPTPINGACGTANGQSFSTAPTANLCVAGTPSAVGNNGSWTWGCAGLYLGTTASCSASVVTSTSCYAQPTGLVSWWRAEGDASDQMGLNNLTLASSVSFATGAVGQAFSFDGATGYVEKFSPDSSLNVRTRSWTISAWLQSSYSGTATQDIVSRYECGWVASCGDPNSALYELFLDGATGKAVFSIRDSSSHEAGVAGTTNLRDGAWHLVTAALNRATTQISIYVDGTLQNSADASTVADINDSGSPLEIGRRFRQGWASPISYFNGLIDEAQIYSRALSATEIQGIYNAGLSGLCH